MEWLPEGSPRAIVQIAHGISEDMRSWRAFGVWLAERGIAAVGHDHLGHGGSRVEGYPKFSFGPRGSWHAAAEDVCARRMLVRTEFPEVPCFLLGHSMGSFLARADMLRHPGTEDGVILMGTGWLSQPMLQLGKILAEEEALRLGAGQVSPLVERMARRACLKAPGNPDGTPLWGEIPCIGLFLEILDGLAEIQNLRKMRSMQPDTPVLFVSGERDPVGFYGPGFRKTVRKFRDAGMRNVTAKLYPGLRHEILLEQRQEEVSRDIFAWILCPDSRSIAELTEFP